MNNEGLKKIADDLYPAILLDKYFSHSLRHKVKITFFVLMFVSFFLMSLTLFKDISNIANVYMIRSTFFIFTSFWIIAYLLEWMYMSYAFKDKGMNIEVAKIILDEDGKDVTRTFFNSVIGQYVIARLGIREDEFKKFLNEKQHTVTKDEYIIIEDNRDSFISLREYGSTLLHYDYELKKFFMERGISIEYFKETLDWVRDIEKKRLNKERWWSIENLARIRSIGRRWTKGNIETLREFGNSIYNIDTYKTLGDKWRAYSTEVDKLEEILSLNPKANVNLLSSDNKINMEIVCSFAKNIADGTIDPRLESKRLYLLDWVKLLSVYTDKQSIEKEMDLILKQSKNADDMFLIINDFALFIEELNKLNADALSIFEETLNEENVQVIALSEMDRYRETIEPDVELNKKFIRINIKDLNRRNVMRLLKEQSFEMEGGKEIFFTYPGLLVIGDVILSKYQKAIASDVLKFLKNVVGEIILKGESIADRKNVVEALDSLNNR